MMRRHAKARKRVLPVYLDVPLFNMPPRKLPASLTPVGMMDRKTHRYDEFMRQAFREVHGRFPRRCARRRTYAVLLARLVVLRTAEYTHTLEADNMPVKPNMYRGNAVSVLVCALRRMGVGVQSLGAIVRHVRVRHVRKQSAYKDFAHECARRVASCAGLTCRHNTRILESVCVWCQLVTRKPSWYVCMCYSLEYQQSRTCRNWCWWHQDADRFFFASGTPYVPLEPASGAGIY